MSPLGAAVISKWIPGGEMHFRRDCLASERTPGRILLGSERLCNKADWVNEMMVQILCGAAYP